MVNYLLIVHSHEQSSINDSHDWRGILIEFDFNMTWKTKGPERRFFFFFFVANDVVPTVAALPSVVVMSWMRQQLIASNKSAIKRTLIEPNTTYHVIKTQHCEKTKLNCLLIDH